MSVINETLDNLKQAKKRASGNVNPTSSVYSEKILKAEKMPMSKNSYIIPLSFAIVVGLLFYVSQLFFSQEGKKPQIASSNAHSWLKDNLQKIQQHASVPKAPKATSHPTNTQNLAAQSMYYEAMALLNEGQEDQAMQNLHKIIVQYPDFAPAQKVYSMLMPH
jgi:hypothetical protein